MTFAGALYSMQQGLKVRRKHWRGYWGIEDGEIIIHRNDGSSLNLRDTDNMIFTLSNIACDDWEVL